MFELIGVFIYWIEMKKTQKVLDVLKYIDSLDLSSDELKRLESEINSLC